MPRLFKRAKKTRIYYTSDIHGSERCWRKFLNAGKFYDADVLIMGGDITGKMIVPIVEESPGHHRARYMGTDHETATTAELEVFEKGVRDNGHYPVRMQPDEVASYSSEAKKKELFEQVMINSLSSWIELAETRLRDSGIQCYVMPGNDDIWAVDKVIAGSGAVVNPDEQCLWLDQEHEMVASGYSNPTPWDTYRELSDEELEAKLAALCSRASKPGNLVACFHVPPYGSGLDSAPQLTSDMRVARAIGEVKMAPVGSKAVANVIREYQPLLTLHGHIHESRGVKKMGRTVAVNPGSEYTEGILSGAIIELDGDKVGRCQLVSG